MANPLEGVAEGRAGGCLLVLVLSGLVWMAGPARADEALAQVRARIGRLDARIAGLASVVPRVAGRPGEAQVLWELARLHRLRAEAHLAAKSLENPPRGELDDLVTGVLPGAAFTADREEYERLCRNLIGRFPQTEAGVAATLDLGITREADGRLDEAGALYAQALKRGRAPQQVARARVYIARWLFYRAQRGTNPGACARALKLLKPVAAGTHGLTARSPYSAGPEDLRRLALWLTGACLGHTGRPGQLKAALSGGGLDAEARVALLEDLAHNYICWRRLPFSAAAYRILLTEHPTHPSAPHWQAALAHVEADLAAGRTGGCHYDFAG